MAQTQRVESEDEEDGDDEAEDGDMKEENLQLNQEEIKAKYSFEAVKKAMAACYVNMAIIHSKSNSWAKVKTAAAR